MKTAPLKFHFILLAIVCIAAILQSCEPEEAEPSSENSSESTNETCNVESSLLCNKWWVLPNNNIAGFKIVKTTSAFGDCLVRFYERNYGGYDTLTSMLNYTESSCPDNYCNFQVTQYDSGITNTLIVYGVTDSTLDAEFEGGLLDIPRMTYISYQ